MTSTFLARVCGLLGTSSVTKNLFLTQIVGCGNMLSEKSVIKATGMSRNVARFYGIFDRGIIFFHTKILNK